MLISLEGGAGADDLFRCSLDWARRQGALSWELRAAISLARSQLPGKRVLDARKHLSEVYQRFSEGFDTADLREARALIAEL